MSAEMGQTGSQSGAGGGVRRLQVRVPHGTFTYQQAVNVVATESRARMVECHLHQDEMRRKWKTRIVDVHSDQSSTPALVPARIRLGCRFTRPRFIRNLRTRHNILSGTSDVGTEPMKSTLLYNWDKMTNAHISIVHVHVENFNLACLCGVGTRSAAGTYAEQGIFLLAYAVPPSSTQSPLLRDENEKRSV